MQTPSWKHLNAIYELLDEKDFQLKLQNNETIIQSILHILHLALFVPYQGPTYTLDEKSLTKNTSQVKSYIISNLLPGIINKTLSSISGEVSL